MRLCPFLSFASMEVLVVPGEVAHHAHLNAHASDDYGVQAVLPIDKPILRVKGEEVVVQLPAVMDDVLGYLAHLHPVYGSVLLVGEVEVVAG